MKIAKGVPTYRGNSPLLVINTQAPGVGTVSQPRGEQDVVSWRQAARKCLHKF